MHIHQFHTLTIEDAKARIDKSWNALVKKELSEGVRIKDPEKSWHGNEMRFSFKAKKGILGVKLNGTLTVAETSVSLECELPALLTRLVPEDKIVAVLQPDLARALAD
jgi:hypothetical protein